MNCKTCGTELIFRLGGFNNYERQGICPECAKNKKTRVCNRCKQEKPLNDFFSTRYGTDKSRMCKPCSTEYGKEYRKKNPTPKVKKAPKPDADIAKDLTKMRW